MPDGQVAPNDRSDERTRSALTHKHPHAQIAAATSEAAATQDLYWPMHDLLFHRHKALEASNPREHAGQVGLDLRRYDQSLADRLTLEARVAEGVSSGTVNGVTGTPTIFLNHELYADSREFEPLDAALIARAD